MGLKGRAPRTKPMFIIMRTSTLHSLPDRYKGLNGYVKFNTQREAEEIARDMVERHGANYAVLKVVSISRVLRPLTETVPFQGEL